MQDIYSVFSTVIGANLPAVLYQLADKVRLHQLMIELGLAEFQPERFCIENASFPCIVKPRQASNAQGAAGTRMSLSSCASDFLLMLAVCWDAIQLEKATCAAGSVGHRVENVSDPYIILELIQASTDYNTDLIA